MQTLKLSKDIADKAYKDGPDTVKQLLETLYPTVYSRDITDRIKTVKDACNHFGKDYANYVYNDDMDSDEVGAMALKRISIFRRAINQDWVADYSNSNQRKYYLWYQYIAGSGFALFGVGSECDYARVGSRLVYATPELGRYADQQIKDDYIKLFTETLNNEFNHPF